MATLCNAASAPYAVASWKLGPVEERRQFRLRLLGLLTARRRQKTRLHLRRQTVGLSNYCLQSAADHHCRAVYFPRLQIDRIVTDVCVGHLHANFGGFRTPCQLLPMEGRLRAPWQGPGGRVPEKTSSRQWCQNRGQYAARERLIQKSCERADHVRISKVHGRWIQMQALRHRGCGS